MKFDDLPKRSGDGKRELQLHNAEITGVSIDAERCLTAWVQFEWPGGGCAFGGIKLGDTDGPNRQPVGAINYCAAFLTACIRVGGVERWEQLKGRPVRVLGEGLGGVIVAVGHFLKDDWFCPRVEFKREGDEA